MISQKMQLCFKGFTLSLWLTYTTRERLFSCRAHCYGKKDAYHNKLVDGISWAVSCVFSSTWRSLLSKRIFSKRKGQFGKQPIIRINKTSEIGSKGGSTDKKSSSVTPSYLQVRVCSLSDQFRQRLSG